MKTSIWVVSTFVLAMSLTAAGCAPSEQTPSVQVPQIDQVTQESQMAATGTPAVEETATTTAVSPSSTLPTSVSGVSDEDECRTAGGSLVGMNSPTGYWKACYFQDNSLCEIGSLRLGDCHPGACHEVCMNQGSVSEGLYDSCSGLLIRRVQCSQPKK